MALIAISGKISSGKDTIGKIIQILIDSPQLSIQGIVNCLKGEYNNPSYQIKKFADSLKDIVCILTGCTRLQLEDQDFKNQELPQEWWYWKLEREGGYSTILIPYPASEKELMECEGLKLIKPTYRLLLQQMGTECGRGILHPNLWVNALFSQYKATGTDKNGFVVEKYQDGNEIAWQPHPLYEPRMFPNWIITDLRFPNELQAVKNRYGITIRVNRPKYDPNATYILEGGGLAGGRGLNEFDKALKAEASIKEHPSETALDKAQFQYTIENSSTIEDLIHKVKEILIKENIIQNATQ